MIICVPLTQKTIVNQYKSFFVLCFQKSKTALMNNKQIPNNIHTYQDNKFGLDAFPHQIKQEDLATEHKGHWYITNNQRTQIESNLKNIPWRPPSVQDSHVNFAGVPVSREQAIHNAFTEREEEHHTEFSAVGYYNNNTGYNRSYRVTGWWAEVPSVNELFLGYRPIPHWLPYKIWFDNVLLLLQGRLKDTFNYRVKNTPGVPTLPAEVIKKHIFPFLQWRNEEKRNKRNISYIINQIEYDRDGIEIFEGKKVAEHFEEEVHQNWGKRSRPNNWGDIRGFTHLNLE